MIKKLKEFKHPQLNNNVQKYMEKIKDQMLTFDGKGVFDTLETKLKEMFNLKYTLTTNSGTSALFSIFYGCGLKPNDEVLVPGYTFFATATPLFVLGCKPVLVDCDENGNMCPQDLERKITKNTKAVVITHIWGIPCQMKEIINIVNRNNLILFEDCSHAHGAEYSGKYVGNFGIASAWSLGAQKLITGGQGGFLGTNNEEIYQRALLIGHFNRRAEREVNLPHLKDYAITGTGLNLRMHPFAAAIILEQLHNFEKQIKERRETANFMIEELKQIPGFKTPLLEENVNPSWYAFPVLFESAKNSSLTRNTMIGELKKAGIDASNAGSTKPLNQYKIFNTINYLPNCDKYYRELIKLPTWYGEQRFDYATYVIDTVKNIIKKEKTNVR